ncbi:MULTISPECIES: NUDIX hydrolase [Streptomyces]|uniref:NUDIX hydrolase n=1 Tax=Streptomyces TaxID=1883 RepID=UPI002E31528A|nr:NUDIX domain-containing protein [Streptomyces canus]
MPSPALASLSAIFPVCPRRTAIPSHFVGSQIPWPDLTTDGHSAANRPRIRDRAGRLLLIRRAVAEVDLLWALPGGTIEPGESPEKPQCGRR